MANDPDMPPELPEPPAGPFNADQGDAIGQLLMAILSELQGLREDIQRLIGS